MFFNIKFYEIKGSILFFLLKILELEILCCR